jgi:uncharacterized MnhB-related membrane protein
MSMGIPSASPYPAYSSATAYSNPVQQQGGVAQPQAMALPAPSPYTDFATSPSTDMGSGTTTDYLMAALTEANDIATNASQQFTNEILPEGRAWQAQQDQLKQQAVGLPTDQAQAQTTPATAPSAAANPFATATPPQRDESMNGYLYYGQAGMMPQTAMPYAQQPYGTAYNQPNLAGTGQGITPTDLNALNDLYQKQGLSPKQSLQQIEAQLQSGQPLAPQAVNNNGNIPFRFGLASAGYFAKGAVVDPVVNTAKLAMNNPLGFVLGAGAIGALAVSSAGVFLAPALAVGSAALGGILAARFIARQVTAQNGAERAKAFEDLGGAATSVLGAAWGAPKAYGALAKAVDGLEDASNIGKLANMKTAQEFSGLPRLEKIKTFWDVTPDATRHATKLAFTKDTWTNHTWTQAAKQFFSSKGAAAAQTADGVADAGAAAKAADTGVDATAAAKPVVAQADDTAAAAQATQGAETAPAAATTDELLAPQPLQNDPKNDFSSFSFPLAISP